MSTGKINGWVKQKNMTFLILQIAQFNQKNPRSIKNGSLKSNGYNCYLKRGTKRPVSQITKNNP